MLQWADGGRGVRFALDRRHDDAVRRMRTTATTSCSRSTRAGEAVSRGPDRRQHEGPLTGPAIAWRFA